MTDHELDSPELDALFAQARAPTPADDGAAERFLSGHRHRQAQYLARQRARRVGWVGTLLASAAAVAGLTVLRPAPELPASAAYGAYQSAWGDGW
ncbi:hypothetical protein QR90_13510 [Deinococcus radiopugnans]|uniref:Uncharacterized protein n=1 Tax=Deinococcus radiopugnans TaxID=57497 RepID=A0A0A7KI86_9DEIO|nr:hypothetical protein [Deinococcus radiopugnans]AIZ45872.1 hypothetical protein QR90_13510 [Deinococcus radiopugnans]